MNKQDIQLLYQYNSWANARILNVASSITSEQFLAPASYPHGGMRGTLTHTLSAEWIWRTRWEGTSPDHGLKPEDFANFESLVARWKAEEKLLLEFVEKLTDTKLNERFRYYKTTGGDPLDRILWQTMAHMVNHGTQHRSEAAAMLTDLGHSPGDIDLSLFLTEAKY